MVMKGKKQARRLPTVLLGCGLLLFFLSGSGPVRAVDFIRGDVNGDGNVSIADAQFLLGWFFLGTVEPECLAAADIRDDKHLNISDAIHVLLFLFHEATPPVSPFPDPGPDPSGDAGLGCLDYGNGSPLEDAAAKLEVMDVTVVGGRERLALVALAVSNSTHIAGYSGALVVEGDILEEQETGRTAIDLLGFESSRGRFDGGFNMVRVEPGSRIEFAIVNAFGFPDWIPPGESVPVVEIPVCLREGTLAGDYAMTPEGVEFADGESGRAITPALASGTLTVLADVEEGAVCSDPPLPPAAINILFELEETSASPGRPVSVPFNVMADRPSQGLAFSLDFDEEVLEATSVERLYAKPDGTPYDFALFEFDNRNTRVGNDGLDEGFIVGVAIISLTDTESVLPADEKTPVLELRFNVRADVPPGETELVFMDGGQGSGDPVENKIIAGGRFISPVLANSFILVDGRINIIPDGSPFRSPFIRADSNGDGQVNISDPQFTLGFLFVGTGEPPCHDAADANDDGAVNIADAIATLQVLFLGVGRIPPPTLGCASDPTVDDISCVAHGPCE